MLEGGAILISRESGENLIRYCLSLVGGLFGNPGEVEVEDRKQAEAQKTQQDLERGEGVQL